MTLRVRYASVAEPRQPWLSEIAQLFSTLQGDGVAYFIGDPPDTPIQAETRVRERVHPQWPHVNKLVMFEEPGAYDVLVALDTDIIAAGDPLTYVSPTHLRAKPVDLDPMSLGEWRSIYEHFRMPFPRERLRATTTGEVIPPYFNSGVIYLPSRYVTPLREAWLPLFIEVFENRHQWPSVARYPFTSDQIAMALAVQRLGIPYDPLPIEANVPTHVPVHESLAPETMRPYDPLPIEANVPTHVPVHESLAPETMRPVFHHHHHRTRAGVPVPTGYAGIDEAIREFAGLGRLRFSMLSRVSRLWWHPRVRRVRRAGRRTGDRLRGTGRSRAR